MDKLIELINLFLTKKFTGEVSVTIVFNQGGIRTVKVDKETR